jgi:phosphoribosylformylglycinamidine synthase
VLSAHDLSEGGLLLAAAEMAFTATQSTGAILDLEGKLPLEAVCFGEEPSRLLLETDEAHLADLLRLAAQYEVPARRIGWTTGGEFRVHFEGRIVLEEDASVLRDAWAASLQRRMRGEA